MRGFYLGAFLLLLSQALAAQSWELEKSDHFLVFHQGDALLAQEVVRESEKNYQLIAEEIGFSRTSNFWTWDNRCKIYIYANKEDFTKETHQPPWSAGSASLSKRTLYTYAGAPNFLNSLLPHEMTHLIFRDFVGFKGEVPLWLDEGLAQYMERDKRTTHRESVKKIIVQGKHIPIPLLTHMDIRRSENTALVALFYAQSSLLVGYLIEHFGSESFTHFCRQLRDGKNLEEALQFAYPQQFRTLEELDQSWVKYMNQT